MTTEQKKIDKAFYSDGYKIGIKAIQPNLTQLSLFQSLEEMYSVIDDLINSLSVFALQHGQAIDCKKGCEWCCHQPVFALSYEMEYLNSIIKKNFSNNIQDEIKIRAEKKNKKLSQLNEKELLNSKFPCPLLENGSCIAYKARPMACRIYLSSDVKSCLNFYKNPNDTNRFPALLDFPMRAGRMMNEGFKAALKSGGLMATEFRIEEILLVPPVKLIAKE